MVCGLCQDISLLRRIGPFGAAFDQNGNTAGDGLQSIEGSVGAWVRCIKSCRAKVLVNEVVWHKWWGRANTHCRRTGLSRLDFHGSLGKAVSSKLVGSGNPPRRLS